MSTYAYRQILHKAQQLTVEEQLRLIEELATMIRQKQQVQEEKPLHSILELEGLGKEIWEGINVEQYIEQERNSWDG